MDLVLHMREGLVRDQDAAGRRLVLEPRGEVHGAADDGVVHAVLAAEIADRAVAGVDADAAAQRRLMPASRHAPASSPMRFCIASAIATQASASSLTPRLSGPPKNIMMASPTYLSIVAPYWSAIFDISVR